MKYYLDLLATGSIHIQDALRFSGTKVHSMDNEVTLSFCTRKVSPEMRRNWLGLVQCASMDNLGKLSLVKLGSKVKLSYNTLC